MVAPCGDAPAASGAQHMTDAICTADVQGSAASVVVHRAFAIFSQLRGRLIPPSPQARRAGCAQCLRDITP